MWVSTTKLAKIEGVTSQTIRRKIESGHYEKIMQTSGGHYRIFINQQRKICYARVSSGKQKSSIDTQKFILLESAPSRARLNIYELFRTNKAFFCTTDQKA